MHDVSIAYARLHLGEREGPQANAVLDGQTMQTVEHINCLAETLFLARVRQSERVFVSRAAHG
jgi:hypothetical protein